jgi:hypothetical protein
MPEMWCFFVIFSRSISLEELGPIQKKKCWTADTMQRHGLQALEVCALCDQQIESIDHLMVQCHFAKEI